jgi:hypothetical protein
MIRKNHEQHVLKALRFIHKCALVDKNGGVSYKVVSGFNEAHQILETLVQPKGVRNNQKDRCLQRALNKFSKSTESDLPSFTKFFNAEIKNDEKRVKYCFETVRSVHSRLSVNLKSRKLFGIYIRSGEIYNINNKEFSNLPKSVLRAVKQRQKIHELVSKREHLPPFREGNLFISARSYANSEAIAREDASFAIDRYLALLNFIAGFGLGNTTFSNPAQPQGVVMPSIYTTVHNKNGNLREQDIYYSPELAIASPSGKSIKNETAKKLEDNLSFILDRIERHFDPELVWDALSFLGAAYTDTHRNTGYMKCWMALERLMCFTQSEAHESMFKRMSKLLNEDFDFGLLESLRVRRNSIAHQGVDISDQRQHLFGSPIGTLINIIELLIRFHVNLPRVIRNRDDFIHFTNLPLDRSALQNRKLLLQAKLNSSRE